jgi:hypothetical protein
MDRIAAPGFSELLDRARAATPADGSIAIRPKNEFGEASREAWEAAWLLWPRKPEILKHDADPFERRGFYIILGEAANPKSARVVFKNRAGALWHVAEGEPR